METELSVNEHLRSLEEKLLNPGVRKSSQELLRLLSDEFVEFGSSGKIYNKSQVIESLKNESEVYITIMNFKAMQLAPEVILLTYTASSINKIINDTRNSLRSSIWKKSDDRWQLVFHQGTPSAEG